MNVPPEMRQAIAEEECARDGHDFGHYVDLASGDPVGVFCARCGKTWKVVPK
jgi:hypothetical protein